MGNIFVYKLYHLSMCELFQQQQKNNRECDQLLKKVRLKMLALCMGNMNCFFLKTRRQYITNSLSINYIYKHRMYPKNLSENK